MKISTSKFIALLSCGVLTLPLFGSRVASAANTGTFKVGEATFKCAPSPVAIVDHTYPGGWNFNQELAANAFAIYAAASYDAYEPRDDGSRAFRVADNHPQLEGDPGYGKTGWTLLKRHQNNSGLLYDVYYRTAPDRLIVMVAYRGTDGWINMDTIANASWLTQWLNPWDQYRQARNEFIDVVAEAAKVAEGKPIAFVTTGHSLGGGLAQHVAHVHPCTSAVVFNSSFVTNTTFYGNYTPRVIRLYEKGDKFEEFAGKIVNNEDHAVYRLTLTNLTGIRFNHSMERFGVGTTRMAIECLTRTGCEIRDGASLAKTLYCDRYFGFRWKRDPQFAARTKDEGICKK
jgi:hypothetical protein